MREFLWRSIQDILVWLVEGKTWAVWFLVLITMPLNVWFGMYYQNPNKLSLTPVNNAYYTGFDQLTLLNRIIDQPFHSTLSEVGDVDPRDDKVMSTAQAFIVYQVKEPLFYRGGNIVLPSYGSVKVPVGQESMRHGTLDALNVRANWETFSFPDLSNHWVYGFRLHSTVEVTVPDGQPGYYYLEDKSELELLDKPFYLPGTCTTQDSWQLMFVSLSDFAPSRLKIDSCSKIAEISVSEFIFDDLLKTGLDKKLAELFGKNFVKTYQGTPDAVLAWTYPVFNAIIAWQPDRDLDQILTALLNNELVKIHNGISFEFVYNKRVHYYYLLKALGVALAWICLAYFAVLQRSNMTWSRFKSDLATPYRFIQVKRLQFRTFCLKQKQRRNEQKIFELQARKAAKLKESEEAEARRVAELKRQAKEAEQAIRQQQETEAQQRRLQDLQQQLLIYQEQGIAEFLQNEAIRKDLLTDLQTAWQELCKLKAKELSLHDQAKLKIIKAFEKALLEVTKVIDTLNQQKQTIMGLLTRLQNLPPIMLSKIKTEDRDKITQIQQQITANGLKSRDLKQMDYCLRKIIQDYSLTV